MMTKAQVKEIRALATSKGRSELKAFIAEGDKLSREWLAASETLRYIIGLPEWLEANSSLISRHSKAKVLAVSQEELTRVSSQQSPNSAIVVPLLPDASRDLPFTEWCLVLDQIQDPGNLGAIIRIADWFGIRHVVCSPGCADYYNPKVVSAAMGGHLRVRLHTALLPEFLQSCSMEVLAATLDGIPAHQAPKPLNAALLIGNESKGLSPEVLRFATQKVTIQKRGGAESLNAAVATGILLSMLL